MQHANMKLGLKPLMNKPETSTMNVASNSLSLSNFELSRSSPLVLFRMRRLLFVPGVKLLRLRDGGLLIVFSKF